jgi:hypothetical protein
MVVAGSLAGAATAVRVGSGGVELLAKRGPRIVRLALKASSADAGASPAQAAFRDELIDLARDSAELVWRELRRGVDDLDAFTRIDRALPEGSRRRYTRVKP